jgi:glycosyltransferase involved in cell wall biosynthesis
MKDANSLPCVVHVITSLDDGGAEASLYRLCMFSSEYRHHVISLVNDGKYGPVLRENGFQVDSLCMPRGVLTLVGFLKLLSLIRRSKPVAVQTWMYHANLIGGIAARLAGVSSVYWGIHHSNLSPGTNKSSTILIAKLCALLSYCIPTRIVSCSRVAVNSHIAIGYKSDKFVTIPNGYDLNSFVADESASIALRRRWLINEGKYLIGMVARDDPQKDHPNLLHALAILKRNGLAFMCVLVGHGMDETNFKILSLIDELKLTDCVILSGRRDDISTVMGALDIHVLSSAGEAFPNVIAEAMACGTPCVSTNVGDVSYIIGENGWLVPAKDSLALANALRDALGQIAHKEEWHTRKIRARSRIANNFTVQNMALLYQRLWSKDIF